MSLRRLFPLAVITGGLGLLAAETLADPVTKSHDFASGTVISSAQVNANFDELVAAVNANTPAGSLMAFAGPAANVPAGWLPCDGSARRSADFGALSAAVGTGWGDGSTGPCLDAAGLATTGCDFNVPDLRGQFLRGTGAGNADEAARTACNTGGNTGAAVGSCQGAATALPATPFATATTGAHQHGGVLQDSASPPQVMYYGGEISFDPSSNRAVGSNQGSTTDSAGDHTHAVDGGGDLETRPVNAYVNYMVKY